MQDPLRNPSTSASPLPQLSTPVSKTPATTTMQCVTAKVPVLLQTAWASVFKINNPRATIEARVIFDSGSQRSYVTNKIKESLSLEPQHTETMLIKTFGSEKGIKQSCDVVSLGMMLCHGGSIELTFLSVPMICEPLYNQPISQAVEKYHYLANLQLADHSCGDDYLGVNILVGSDNYWKLVTEMNIQESDGPMAVQTKLGWVLSGPIEGLLCKSTLCNLVTTHVLMVDLYVPEDDKHSLDNRLKMFWDLESLGIAHDEVDVYKEFEKTVHFEDGRYQVYLPWKRSHSALATHYDLSLKRLTGLLRRLRQNPDVFRQYNAVIREQLQKGIVEVVDDGEAQNRPIHYLPHHPVVREDKLTTSSE